MNTTKKRTVGTTTILVALLCACATMTVAAGGQTEAVDGEDAVTIRFAYLGGDFDSEVYGTRIAAFEAAHPHIAVETEQIVDEYDQRLRLSIASGDIPDVMWMAESILGYADSGVLEPLNPYIESSGLDMTERFGENLPRVYARDGNQYGMPDRAGGMVLYYNTDLFDAAGVAYPTDEWRWDDFIAAAQAITAAGGGEYWGSAIGFDWWPWEYGMIYGHGGAVLDANGRPVYDSPAVTEALTLYRDLFYRYAVTPTPEDYADAGITSPDVFFARGVAAMNMTGGWAISALADAEFGWDMAVVPSQGYPSTTVFGSALAMSADSRHKEAAFTFIEWMSSAESQRIIAEMRHDVPAHAEIAATVYPEAMAIEGREIALDTFARGNQRAYPIPLHPRWTEITNATTNGIERIVLQREPVEAVQGDVQAELERIIGR